MSNYPEKKHSKPINDNRAREGMEVGVQAGVAEGSHLPFVSLSLGDRTVRLPVGDAIDMANTTRQAACMAYQDATLVSYLMAIKGMEALPAYQEMIQFQTFREVMSKQQAEMQAAAEGRQEAGEVEAAPSGFDQDGG